MPSGAGMGRSRHCILAVAAVLVAASAAGAADPGWRQEYYNPAPSPDDLVLPMPCGGAMAFRRIATSSPDGAIGDVDRVLGSEAGQQPYVNGLRHDQVSGPFPQAEGGGEGGKTVYYMGKYEIAAAQYAVVTASECPEPPRRRDFLPATDVSRLEFEEFAERYTLWLMREAPEALPRVGDAPGFLRLPTEAEWEFAGRGGEAVEPVAFRAPLPPMAAGEAPSEFIAHGGSDSAGGTVQAIGTLRPNPLGLHDMLGNVAEFVGTPFALVRHGRLHGRTGGSVKRGGDARTPLASIDSSTRFEVPPFDAAAKDQMRERYTGARLAIAGLALPSPETAKAITAGLDRLAAVDPALPSAASEDDVLALLAGMRTEAATPGQIGRIDLVVATLQEARAERNGLRDKALRLLIESGAWMCDLAVVRHRNRIQLEQQLANIEAYRLPGTDAETLREIDLAVGEARTKLGELDGNIQDHALRYANLIDGLAEDYSQDLVDRQARFVQSQQLQRQQLTAARRSAQCVDLLLGTIDDRHATGRTDLSRVNRDFRDMAEQEIAQEKREGR